MRMEVDAITESLDYSHHTRHELTACGCVEKPDERLHRRETERIEEPSLEAEEQTQHLGDGENDLTVRGIQEKLLPHPLAPLLTALGMTRWTKSARLAGKHQQPLFPAVRTPDTGKPAHRIAAIEIFFNNIFNDWTEISVFLLETILIFSEKLLEIMKKHPVEYCEFRMTLAVDPCHGGRDGSKNEPFV
ncbi:MAG: hypothetical protein R6V02_05565 [Candidatus Aminicenantes bacterium]